MTGDVGNEKAHPEAAGEKDRTDSTLLVDSIDVYYGDLQVLWNLSLNVKKGSIVSLVGSNGAGKTTTLKTIAGVLKPRNGRISLGGTVTNTLGVQDIVDIGLVYVPEGRGLFPDMSVEENLVMGSYNPRARRSRDDTMGKVYRLFPRLNERSGQRAGTLSGGEAQMLAIARGMMARPKVLMLDEPSSGLAPIVVDIIFDAIKEMSLQGITILLVEQDAGRALRISDYAYLLETGRITHSGRGEDLLGDKYVREGYLGM